MIIRLHNAEDIDWVITQHGKLYHLEFGFNEEFVENIATKMHVFLGEDKDPFDKLWIAEVGSERAGSIAVSKKSDRVGFINFVLVLNEFRGKGVAKQLFNKLLNHCKANEVKSLQLETYSCLVSARKLYKMMGFRIYQVNPAVTRFGQTFNQEFWELQID